MFCPKCGTDGQAESSYCKRCGQWIPSGEAPAWYDTGQMSPERTLRLLANFNLLGAALAFACGVALFASIAAKAGLHFFGGLVALYCILLAAFQLLTVSIVRSLRRRLEGARGAELKGVAPAPALGAVDTAPLDVGRSVTEQATEILEPLPARRREGGEPG
jgi:hypothetical protein